MAEVCPICGEEMGDSREDVFEHYAKKHKEEDSEKEWEDLNY